MMADALSHLHYFDKTQDELEPILSLNIVLSPIQCSLDDCTAETIANKPECIFKGMSHRYGDC